jgi:3-carboxy-cis,cis-muconate cycloisomerase
MALLAEELDLAEPDLPWHAERDRIVALASALGITAGAMAKIAEDLVLLAQTEVGEVAEGAAPGKGGSSTLPQKRNPVDATFALASARLAAGVMPLFFTGMAQEHERAAGAWQAEWDALPRLFCYTAGAVERIAAALTGLEVRADAMRANLDRTGGLLLAEALSTSLAPHTGRPEAQHLVEAASKRASQQDRTLEDVALADEQISAVLDPETIHAVFDPTAYLGSMDAFIDRALASWQSPGSSPSLPALGERARG